MPADDRNTDHVSEGSLTSSFIGVLLVDVLEAQARRERSDRQSTRRDLIRAIFAAIEGLAWRYREHITSIARDVGEIAPLEEQALTEISAQVILDGRVIEQPRLIPLLNTIRLVSRIAVRLDPALSLSFDNAGWAGFRDALIIRHRITHPKQLSDIEISADDVATCRGALDWLAETIAVAGDAAQEVFENFTISLRSLVDQLKAGDPRRSPNTTAPSAPPINPILVPPYMFRGSSPSRGDRRASSS